MFIPGNNLPESSFLETIHADKLVHLFLYGVLFLLWSYGWNQQYSQQRFRLQVETLSVGMTVVYGTIIEILQPYISQQRAFEFGDLVMNLAGVFTGLILWLLLLRSKIS